MQGLYQRAWAAFELKKYELCCQCALDGLREDPQDIELMVLLGHCKLVMGEYGAGRAWGQHVIEMAPEDSRGFSLLARATISDAQFDPDAMPLPGDGAAQVFQATEPPGFDPEKAHLARVKRGRELANRSLELDPQQAANFALLAQIEFLSGDPSAALEAANRGLAVDPRHASSAHARTRALTDLRRFDEAIATARNQLHFDPEDVDSHYHLGRLYLQSRDLDAATRHARQAVRLDPSDAQHRQSYWDTVKARNPFFRPFVYWQFIAHRLGGVSQGWKNAALFGVCGASGLLAAMAKKGWGFEGAPFLMLLPVGIAVFFFASERPCMLLVDLMMFVIDKEYRSTVEPKKMWIDAGITFLAFALIASLAFAAFDIFTPVIMLFVGLLLLAPAYCLWTADSKWVKALFAVSIFVMLMLFKMSVETYQESQPNTNERMISAYYFMGLLMVGVSIPVLYAHFTLDESYLK